MYQGDIAEWKRTTIRNIQLLHECRDSRDDHFFARRRGQAIEDYPLDRGMFEDKDMDEDEVVGHLDAVDRARQQRQDRLHEDVETCMAWAEAAGLYGSLSSRERDEGGLAHELVRADAREEDEWREAYQEKRASFRRMLERGEEEEEAGGAPEPMDGNALIEWCQLH